MTLPRLNWEPDLRPSSVGLLGIHGLGIDGIVRVAMMASLLPDHPWEKLLGYAP